LCVVYTKPFRFERLVRLDTSMDAMTRQRQLQEDTHFRVLSLLEQNPDMSQRDLAKALGVSLGGVNYSLKALMERGMVKVQNFSKSERKLAYAYVLTPQGLAEKTKLTARFLKRKMEEYEALKSEIDSLQYALNVKRQSNLMFDNEH
jgi:EPS-associated MarR family transcriptional regulator